MSSDRRTETDRVRRSDVAITRCTFAVTGSASAAAGPSRSDGALHVQTSRDHLQRTVGFWVETIEPTRCTGLKVGV
ncbi:hypothetical protein [Dactylosporangium sp. NPDC048998]|uniref:hypothetical protein n=1 Tax=Dactylosporangium sp. NPDC048998 TaxID=3363976 RepID=UPI003713B3F1